MESTDKFNEIKAEILSRAKEADACKEQYGRAYKSETLAELMQVVKDNFDWACRNKVITPDLIEKYREEFAENNIWLNVNVTSGFLLCGNSTVEAWGNSTVEAWDNSTVKAYDNSTVEAYDNSTVEAWDNSTVKAYDNSTVKAWGNSYTSSYYKIECKLSDNAVYRVQSENTIYFANENMKFVKQD